MKYPDNKSWQEEKVRLSETYSEVWVAVAENSSAAGQFLSGQQMKASSVHKYKYKYHNSFIKQSQII